MPATESQPEVLLRVERLYKTYHRGNQPIPALRGVDLDVHSGSFLIILGPSGGGKSTLLHVLGGIDRPTSGHVWLNGIDIATASQSQLARLRREKIGFVFQFHNLLSSLDAQDNVMLPLLARGAGWKTARQQAQRALDQVGLTQRLFHRPDQLSGGEQQRVAIARALVVKPILVLADEPTGDLDTQTTTEIIALMHQLNSELGITFVTVTHNPSLTNFASHIYHMHDGQLALTKRS